MIFWMIATLTTHHKMVKGKKPWLSYRTTLVPAPPAPPRARNSALVRTTKTARGPERSRLSHFLRICCCVFFSPWSRISTTLSGSDLGLAWLGLAWLVGKSPSQDQHPRRRRPPPSVWLPGLSLCSYCHNGRSGVLAQLGGMIGFLVLSPSHDDEDDPESRISHNPKRITNRHISWIAADSLPSCSLSTRLMLYKLLVVVVSFLEGKERKGKGRFK